MAVENLEVRSCNDGVFSSEMYGLKWKGKSVRNITTINQIGSAMFLCPLIYKIK
jgi:hypothetical protein